MRIKSSRSIRLYIRVTINGESYSSQVKNRIFDFVQGRLSANSEADGRCLIVYDSKNDYWNEFRFKTVSEFRENLTVNTELPLLKYLAS